MAGEIEKPKVDVPDELKELVEGAFGEEVRPTEQVEGSHPDAADEALNLFKKQYEANILRRARS